MAMNFLQGLFNPRQSPSMPTASASAPAMPMPQMQGDFQRMTQAVPDDARIMNIMQAIGQTPNTPSVQMPTQMQQPQNAEPPRKRRSFLETIGQLSDVVARIGGSEAMYQPTLDARDDRARALDLEEMRKQLLEQQITQGEQTLQAGEEELAGGERGRLAQALGAVAADPANVAMWPQIAAEAGIPEDRAAQIGAILQNNPKAAGIFAQSLGWSPEVGGRQGSQAKELQVYGLLMEQSPELAKAYLQNLVNPDAMTEYQRGQLAIALQTLGLKQEEVAFDQGIEEEKLDLERDKAAAGGVNLTPKQRGDITMKLKLLPVAKQQYARVKQLYNEMIEEGTLTRGPLGGMVPTAFAGPKAEEFDKAVGALRKSILSMTRVPGVGAMSNYETMLDEAALPTRWGSDEGRLEAITNIGSLLDNYEQGYKDMLGTPAPAASPRRGARPRSGGRSEGTAPRIVTVTSPDEARSLPSGTRFRTPDGRVRIKR